MFRGFGEGRGGTVDFQFFQEYLMKRVLSRIAVCCCLMFTGMAQAQSLANRIPADALIYADWQGTEQLQPVYQGTHLKALVDASTFPEFLEKGLPNLLAKIPNSNEQEIEIAKLIIDLSKAAIKHPTAVYVGPISAEPNSIPQPKVVILIQAGTDADALVKQLDPFVQQAAGGPISVTLEADGPNLLAVIGKISTDEHDLLLGKPHVGATLTADPSFKAALAQVQKNAAMTLYANAPAILKNLDTLPIPPGDKAQLTKVLQSLKTDTLQSLILTEGFAGKDWTSQSFLGFKPGTGAAAPHTGLAALLDTKPVTDAQLKLIPVTAVWATACRVDLAAITQNIRVTANSIDPRGTEMLEEGLHQFTENFGIDLEAGLIKPLGDQWVLYSAPNVGGAGFMGAVAINQLSDAKTFAASLDTLDTRINEMIQQSMGMMGGRGGPEFAIRTYTTEGIKVHHIALMVFDPAWAVHDGKLYLAMTPQVIPAAVAAGQAKTSLLDNPGYQAILQRLKGEAKIQPTSITYMDLSTLVTETYPMFSQLFSMPSFLGGSDIPPTILPPLHKILPELAPAASITWVDAAGFHSKSLSPIPGGMAFSGQSGMVAAPLAVAILFPSIGRSREMAHRSVDAANLTGIAKASIVYANDHNDKLPEHPAELVALGMISPKILIRPGSGTTPAQFTAEQSAGMAQDWHLIEQTIDAHCDYIYFGKGMPNSMDSTACLIMTKPSLPISREGVNVAFGDCHPEWVRRPNLDEDFFKPTNEARKSAGLDPIDVEKLVASFKPNRRPAPATQPQN